MRGRAGGRPMPRAPLLLLAPLALLIMANPAQAQLATTPGDAYGCASTTYRPEAAPDVAVTRFDCGEATCLWVRQEGTYVTFAQCVPGGPGVQDGRACHDTGAWAWHEGQSTYARERRCLGAQARDDGACLVRTSEVQDGRAAYVAHECVTAEGTRACRSERYAWDYGGTFAEEACAGVEARREPCGRAAYLVVGDVTGMADAAGGLYPWETRVACAPF